MMLDPNDDPVQAAIKKAKAELAAEQAAQQAQNTKPSNPTTGQRPTPTFASESTAASTQPRKPGDVGAIDPIGFGANALNSAAFQFGDEALGVIGGGINKMRGGSFGEGYDQTRGAFNKVADTYRQNHPTGALVADVTGAIAPMALTMGGSAAGEGVATLSQLAKAGGKAGAKFGAISGVGAGDGVGDRVWKGVTGAGAGYLMGAALPTAVVGAVRAPSAAATYAAEKLGAESVPARGLAALARGTDKVTQKVGNAVNQWWNGGTGALPNAAGDAAARVEVPVIPTRTRQTLDALASRGANPTEIMGTHGAAMADNAPAMPFAAMLPDNAQRTARAADAISQQGQTRAALEARVRQQGPNLAQHIDGPEITPSVTIPELKKQAQQASDRTFEVAHSQPAFRAPEVDAMLETPFGEQLYNAATKHAQNDLRWRAEFPSLQELRAKPAQSANEAFQRTMGGELPMPKIPEQLPPHINEAVEQALAHMAQDTPITPELRKQVTGAALNAYDASQSARSLYEPKLLHRMKIAADDAYEMAMTDSERAMADQYRRELLKVLEDETRAPEMANALKAYETPMASGNAVSTAFSGDGARALPSVLNAPPRAVKAEISRLAARDAERGTEAAPFYQNSGKQMLRDYLGKIRPDRDVTKTLFPDGPKDELVQALLTEAEAGKFGRQLEREQMVGRAKDNILGNSSTARNQQDIRLLNEQANGGSLLPLSERGTTLSEDIVRSGSLRQPLKSRAADWLRNRRLAKTEGLANEIDRIGAMDNADDIATLLQTWADRQRSVYQPLGMAARASGRIAGQTRR